MQPALAEVFDNTTNHAVDQLPGRRFPGSVVQGDSLCGLLTTALDIQRAARAAVPKGHELHAEIAFLVRELRERLTHYESVLSSRGLQLPYNPP